MGESSYDYLKRRDAAEKEDKPWLDFNYAETVTPETLFDKIKNAAHKLNIKGALETITANSSSKLNSTKTADSTNKNLQTGIEVTSIQTHEENTVEKNNGPEKD